MGKSSPAIPPAPDYAAAATAQGTANLASARTSAQLSNPNVNGPLGNQVVTWNGDQPTITQTLTPAAQATLDAQQQAELGMANLAQQGTGTVANALSQPF